MSRLYRFSLFLASIVLLCGCASLRSDPAKYNQPTTASNAIPPEGVLQNGYALLFDVLGDEKDVSLLRFIKHERPELKSLMGDISGTAAGAYKHIEDFGKADPKMNLKNEGLPLAELAARKSISTMKTRLLLHNKGAEFRLHLLLSQNEALVYAANLAQVIAVSETDSQRAAFLRNTATTLLRLDQRVVEMLLQLSETLPPSAK
jgi:hypothetical protein